LVRGLTLKAKKSGNYEQQRLDTDKHGSRKKARDKYAYSCREQAHSYNYGNFSHGYSSFLDNLLCTALYAAFSDYDTNADECCLFWRNKIIYCYVQLYTPTFRNRKSRALKSVNQKIFAAQTPQRKRGYVEDFTLKSVNAYRN